MNCKHASSGCNYPESECAGLCMHRVTAIVQYPLELSPSEEKAIKTCGCIFIALICLGILSAIYML
jgi:hypothetical protein